MWLFTRCQPVNLPRSVYPERWPLDVKYLHHRKRLNKDHGYLNDASGKDVTVKDAHPEIMPLGSVSPRP